MSRTDPSAIDTVIFDLDGTISDSAPGILASLGHAFAETRLTPPDELLRFIGPPLQTAFTEEGFSDDEISVLMTSYRAHYWDVGAFGNQVYDGIETVLDELAAAGYRLAIATSKPEPTALRILAHFGYLERFEVIGGASFDMSRATKTAVLAHVLEHLGECRAVMVGDRHHDVEGAAAFGIDCIGVAWGYAQHDELERAGARWIVTAPKEIVDIVRGGGGS